MSDETTTFSTSGEPGSRELARQMARKTDEVAQLLLNQQEILRRRGMNLPGGAIESLRNMRTRIDSLTKLLAGSQAELKSLRALAETTALINSSLGTDEVLNQVMDTVIRLTGAERGYIVLKNRTTGALEFRVARGIDREQLAEGNGNSHKTDFIISKSIVNDVAESGEPVITNNAIEDERYQQKQSIVGYALRSILAVPLKLRGEVIGVVYCDNRILSGLFQQHEMEMLEAFAGQAAVAIDNARLFEEARAQLEQVTSMRDLMDNIFESIASGVITTDAHYRITATNAAARAILGKPDEMLIGQPLADALPELDDQFYRRLEQVLMSGSGELLGVQPVVPAFSVPNRHWNVTASVLRAVQGYGQGLALMIDDVTDQKIHEAQLAEVKRYLPTALVNNIRSVDDIDTGGQERQITALFADVRGFTSFSEKLEPETLMRVINRYLSVASDAINLYEGIVDKYMGDAVTGLFNTQLNPQKDHALRAVSAAYSILYDLYALHEVLPENQRLYYGIGIHTGIAVLGNVGSHDRKEFAALGDAPEVCKILQENASGNIIISPQTYEYVKNDFECEAIQLTRTKGRRDLTIGYRVVNRLKSSSTGHMWIDPELADLLKDMED